MMMILLVALLPAAYGSVCEDSPAASDCGVVPIPRQQLLVMDHFYSDVDAVREQALRAEFTVQGNYPGWRTRPMVTNSTKQYLAALLGCETFSYWPTDSYNGAFQYTLATHRSWIHFDQTSWAGIVFLTPNAPANSGTRFYRHKTTGLSERPTEADAQRLGFDNANALIDHVYKDAQQYDRWELVDEVGNVFNRLVLFRGSRFHQSAEYFGDCLENARLFQTFFFDCSPLE
jgi:hypothetical protein